MLDREELWGIRKFTSKQETDTAIHSLEGILKGIALDKDINNKEIEELNYWCNHHYEYISNHPFNQIIPLIRGIISDGIVIDEEYQDLFWFITQLTTENKYYDVITSDIQRLEGLLHGILADNVINDVEINNLKKWLLDNEQLIGIYPFDELESLVIGITQDGIITDQERSYFKRFISDFIDTKKMVHVDSNELELLKKEICIGGICTINPQIEFSDKFFCFTGISKKSKKKRL